MHRMKGFLMIAALFAVLAAVAVVLYGPGSSGHAGHGSRGDAVQGEGLAPGDYWTCGMHPQIQKTKPGRCPLCFMDLIPASSLHGATTDTASANETSVIRIAPEMVARLGIVTVAAEEGPIAQTIRTVGRLEPAQDRVTQVQTRMQGWVTRLDASAQGNPVHRGEPLLAIYSPEITAVEEEYRIATLAELRMSSSPDPDARARAMNLKESALERLRRLDLPEDEIERLVATGEASRSFDVLSPVTGYVLELGIRQGAQVEPGQTLYTLADLTEVWLLADAYEGEMDSVREGARAHAVFRQIPGETFAGQVEYVYPTLDGEARTNKLRIVLANPRLRLRPGMFADVTISLPAERGVSIPLDAVIRTGTRDIAYVEVGPGRYEARDLHLGAQRDGRYLVLHGLAKGDKVVSRANFFIDSEASLRRALQSGAPAGHAGHGGK